MTKRFRKWLGTEQGRAYAEANKKLQAELERVGGGLLDVSKVLTPEELAKLEAGREVMRDVQTKQRRSGVAAKPSKTVGSISGWIN